MSGYEFRWPRVARLAVLAASVAAAATGFAALGSGTVMAQVNNNFDGILTVIWGDPRPGDSGGAIRFKLTEPNGATHPLQIEEAQQAAAAQFFGKRVTVQGRANSSAALGPSTIVVDQITSAEPNNSAPIQPQAATVGTRKALFLLLRFRGDTQVPHSPSFYTNLVNPLTPAASTHTPTTINGFFDKTSWGQLKFAATVGGNKWFVLPGKKADYAPCNNFASSCADIDLIAQDAMTLAVNAGINVAAYSTINFVLNNDLDCCAWGGNFMFGGKLYSATWEPPWAQHAETYVHELGHSLGLPHSGWKYYAYDSPWDIMSMHNPIHAMSCGSYTSRNSGNTVQPIDCPEPGSGYIAAHKDFLGWIPAANKVVIAAKTSATGQTVRLSAGATALGNTIKMIKICLVNVSCASHFLTVEAKMGGTQNSFDRGVPHDGVIIHDVNMNRGSISGGCYFNSQSGWAVPIDATAGDFHKATCSPESFQSSSSGNAGLGNAQFGPGQTYTDVLHGIKVRVTALVTNGFRVNVIRSK
jgi:hypothetical protein